MLFTKIMYMGLLALGASAVAVVSSGQLSPPLPTTTSGELSPASASLSSALLVSTQAAPAPVISQSTGVVPSESTALATITSSTSASASANFTSNGNATNRIVPGSGWATFYDDNQCTVNGGEAVSVSNKGCLGERGRNSIYIQPGESDAEVFSYSLVLTPGGGCNCQVQCIEGLVHGETTNFCYNLNGHADAESFRFIQGGCGKNNC